MLVKRSMSALLWAQCVKMVYVWILLEVSNVTVTEGNHSDAMNIVYNFTNMLIEIEIL